MIIAGISPEISPRRRFFPRIILRILTRITPGKNPIYSKIPPTTTSRIFLGMLPKTSPELLTKISSGVYEQIIPGSQSLQ